MSLKIECAPLEQLQDVLPGLLSSLSIGRTQITLEQLRNHLQHRPHEEILFYLVSERIESEFDADLQAQATTPIAALIAIHQPVAAQSGPEYEPTGSSDSATILHADFIHNRTGELVTSGESTPLTGAGGTDAIHPQAQIADHEVIKQVQLFVDRDMNQRGICFVQWATDEVGHSIQPWQWHHGLGFSKVANLDYLTGETASSNTPSSNAPRTHISEAKIALRPLQWECRESRQAFTNLVEATYTGTLDCPELSNYRTTSETLRGYQNAASFAPDLWFEVLDARVSSTSPLGCMILARHGMRSESEDSTETTQLEADRHQIAAQTASPNDLGSNDLGSNDLGSNDLGPNDVGINDQAVSENSAPPVLEIVYMGLLPEARGIGLGGQLVDQAMNLANQLGGNQFILGVDQANLPARAIYAAKGMTPLMTETVWVKRVVSAPDQPE